MKAKNKVLMTAVALFYASSMYANDDNLVLEKVCGNKDHHSYVEVYVGESLTMIPTSGNMYLIQARGQSLDPQNLAELMMKKFDVSRDCAELLLVNSHMANSSDSNLLASIKFDFDRSLLTPLSKQILDRIVGIAKESKDEFVLTGHTDSIGTNEYNFTLGVQRAESVNRYLNARGISNTAVISKGETQPVATNETSQGRAQNRRVDVTAL